MSVDPGCTTLTVIPRGPRSRASPFVETDECRLAHGVATSCRRQERAPQGRCRCSQCIRPRADGATPLATRETRLHVDRQGPLQLLARHVLGRPEPRIFPRCSPGCPRPPSSLALRSTASTSAVGLGVRPLGWPVRAAQCPGSVVRRCGRVRLQSHTSTPHRHHPVPGAGQWRGRCRDCRRHQSNLAIEVFH